MRVGCVLKVHDCNEAPVRRIEKSENQEVLM